MKQTVVPAQYLQIALDLAGRVARGELPEGSRVYGRSIMASEYNVSPETIRLRFRNSFPNTSQKCRLAPVIHIRFCPQDNR